MRGIGDFLYEYLAVVNDGKQQSLNQARPERGARFLPHGAAGKPDGEGIALIGARFFEECGVAVKAKEAHTRICLAVKVLPRRSVARAFGSAAKEIFAFSKIFVHNLLTSAYIGV